MITQTKMLIRSMLNFITQLSGILVFHWSDAATGSFKVTMKWKQQQIVSSVL